MWSGHGSRGCLFAKSTEGVSEDARAGPAPSAHAPSFARAKTIDEISDRRMRRRKTRVNKLGRQHGQKMGARQREQDGVTVRRHHKRISGGCRTA